MEDEPPRFMGEGFVVLQSNRVDLYYYMDEPGNFASEFSLYEMLQWQWPLYTERLECMRDHLRP